MGEENTNDNRLIVYVSEVLLECDPDFILLPSFNRSDWSIAFTPDGKLVIEDFQPNVIYHLFMLNPDAKIRTDFGLMTNEVYYINAKA